MALSSLTFSTVCCETGTINQLHDEGFIIICSMDYRGVTGMLASVETIEGSRILAEYYRSSRPLDRFGIFFPNGNYLFEYEVPHYDQAKYIQLAMN